MKVKKVQRFAPFSSLLVLVRIDVKLAMQAFAQIEKGHAVHVKVVSAPGTPGAGRNRCEDTEKNYPDDKNRTRSLVRPCQAESCPHRRHVDKNHAPQKPAALPDFPKPRAEIR